VEPEIFLAKGQTDISKLIVVLIIVRFCFNYCQISRSIHVKYPLLLSDFSEPGIFSTGFSKCTQISNFLKIPPVEPEIFLAEGQTDISKLIVVFRNFVKEPNN
jgi:hypothetical protein